MKAPDEIEECPACQQEGEFAADDDWWECWTIGCQVLTYKARGV